MTREEREDAIDIIQLILDKYEEDECLVTEITIGDEDIKAFKMAIEALEQKPKTGHWIPRNSFLLQYKCSECGWESEKYNYCPNCGVKMIEPQESEDKE